MSNTLNAPYLYLRSLRLIWGWRCPVPCLGKHSKCCIHSVKTFLFAFFTKKEQFLQGSSPLSDTGLWNNPYNLALVSHGQDTIETGTKGFSKKCFQGDGMHCSPAVSFHSTDSKHRNTTFPPVTYNNTDITVLRHSVLSLSSFLYGTQGSLACPAPSSLPPFLFLSSALAMNIRSCHCLSEQTWFISSLSHSLCCLVLTARSAQAQDAPGILDVHVRIGLVESMPASSKTVAAPLGSHS